MRLDFAVETNVDNLTKILETGYQVNNITYTSPRFCIAYPGEFYLIPLRPRIVDLATVVYLAAFDGHKRIYLLGFDGQDSVDSNNNISESYTRVSSNGDA